MGKGRWLGRQKYRLAQWLRGVAYRTATPWGRRVVSEFWEAQAPYVHERWGDAQHDFPILRRLLHDYQPQRLLDVGCGSGRLFGLYREQGIPEVIGLDLSAKALALAKARYPVVQTVQGKVEEVALLPGYFDLAICNRVLQHLPPHAIANAVAHLCRRCRLIYINELTEQEPIPEEFFMFRHSYPQLFAAHGFQLRETGEIAEQRYQVFGQIGAGQQPL